MGHCGGCRNESDPVSSLKNLTGKINAHFTQFLECLQCVYPLVGPGDTGKADQLI